MLNFDYPLFQNLSAKRIITISLFSLAFFLLGGCYMLKRFVFTDQELIDHYKNKALKPVYKTISFLNHNLHYAIISKSDTLPLLMFVHGAPGAWYGYMNLMDDSLLQTKFKMVSIDRLGYGKSDYGKPELSIQMQSLEVKRILEQENLAHKKVFLLGRSYGAPIAAWYAINYPQYVEKLMMVSPVIDPAKEKFYWFSKLAKSDFVQIFLPKMLNVATSEKYAHTEEMKKMLPKWKRLYTPTYVLMGEKDDIADTANFTFAKQHLVNCCCTFLKLKNTGHLITKEQPELIKKLLLEKNN